MLDLREIRNRAEEVKANVRNRNMDVDVDALLTLDEQVRATAHELDEVRRRRNEVSQQMKGAADAEARQPLVEEGRQLKEREAELSERHRTEEAERRALLAQVPNFAHPDSPIGLDDTENVALRQHGTVPEMAFEPKDHVTLMEALDLVDFEAGGRVAGAKFYYLKNEAVLLELALVNHATRILREEGFTLMTTPDLARQDILDGIGYNPRGESTQIYSIENTDLSLVATAEITLGGMHKDQVLEAEQLPLLYGGISHCFRTESGSAGRESRGLYRVHQFTKVEMFAFCRPEESEAIHQRMVEIEERIYNELELPYRVMDICTGDLGSPAYRKYDLEAWMPGRGDWGEITSTSNCTDYQARRLNIRYKEKGKKGTQLVHTLNGTAVAVSRAMLALVENGQQADGSVHFPACLGLEPVRPR